MKAKKTFSVGITKRLIVDGRITVEADSEDDAIRIIENRIHGKHMEKGQVRLMTNDKDITWNKPVYEDFSFEVKDDVEELEAK